MERLVGTKYLFSREGRFAFIKKEFIRDENEKIDCTAMSFEAKLACLIDYYTIKAWFANRARKQKQTSSFVNYSTDLNLNVSLSSQKSRISCRFSFWVCLAFSRSHSWILSNKGMSVTPLRPSVECTVWVDLHQYHKLSLCPNKHGSFPPSF